MSEIDINCSYYKDVIKKEIIIDGVNVAGCCCFENSRCLWSKRYYENNNVAPPCEAVKNCYFKQLKRLQEENKSLQMLSCANCGEKYLSPDGSELYEKNVQLQQALEEIREYCDKCKKCVEIGDEVILYTVIKKINEVLEDSEDDTTIDKQTNN